MEADPSIGTYTTEFRQLDVRLGRWWAVDPLRAEQPERTPYGFCRNTPLTYVDPNGDTEYIIYTVQTIQIGNNLTITKPILEIFSINDGVDQVVQVLGPMFENYHGLGPQDGSWESRAASMGSSDFMKAAIAAGAVSLVPLDDGVGLLSRLVFAEARGGSDQDKAVVAESARNRMRYAGKHKAQGMGSGNLKVAIEALGAYNVLNPDEDNHDEFLNPYTEVNSSKASRLGWVNSIRAAWNALFNGSNEANGAHYYRSGPKWASDYEQDVKKLTPTEDDDDAPLKEINHLKDKKRTKTISETQSSENKIKAAWRLDE